MGLKNFMAEHCYVAISNVTYAKEYRTVRFEINVFQDESKTVFLASRRFDTHGTMSYRKFLGATNTPPLNPKYGDTWLVGPNPVGGGDWTKRAGFLVRFDEELKDWAYWFCGGPEIFHNITTNSYVRIDKKTKELLPVDPAEIEDRDWWDRWFAPEIVFSPESNLYRQIYLFLKQCPGFENVVDC